MRLKFNNLIAIIFLAIALSINHYDFLINPCRKGQNGNQFFSHPENPNKYIQCSQWGQMFEFSCPPGLAWNLEKLSCERQDVFSFFNPFVKSTQPSQVTRSTTKLTPITLSTVQSTFSNRLLGSFQPITKPNFVTNFSPQPVVTRSTTASLTVNPEVSVQQQLNPQAFQPAKSAVTQTFLEPANQPTNQEFNQLNNQPASSIVFQQTTQPSNQQINQPGIQPFVSAVIQPVTQPTVRSTLSRLIQTTSTPVISTIPISTSTLINTIPTTQNIIIPQPQEQVISTSDCSTILVSDSLVSVVNGVYTRLNPDLYRRSDNLRVPGLIVRLTPTQWCLTLSFSSTDLNSVSVANVRNSCGSNLECCMLISNSASDLSIDSDSRQWIVNILESKGTQDDEIKFNCANVKKICLRVPFCPPECLKHEDGCDVCECDGKPFFSFSQNSIPPQNEVSMQKQQQQPVKNIAPLQQTQRLLSMNQNKTSNDLKQTNPTEKVEISIISSCRMVHCPTGLVCGEAVNCKTCNPMCFPKEKFDAAHGRKLTCDQISCPTNSKCLLDPIDSLLKCMTTFVQNDTNLEIINDLGTSTTESVSTTILTTTTSTSKTTTVQTIPSQRPTFLPPINQQASSKFVVKSCSMVKCPTGFMCGEALSCATCNPVCFPPNRFNLASGVKITCQNVNCPHSFRCQLDAIEKNLKCVL